MSNSGCPHTTIMKNLCSACGVLIKNDTESLKADGRVALLHNVPDLFVTKDLAHEIGNNERKRLLKSKKLILIVDLDQTIIHSSVIYVRNMGLVDMKKHTEIIKSIVKISPDKYLSRMHQNTFQYTFFRENLREFFQDLEPYFEFHVFTMGTRDYAKPIINFLDPNGKLFGSRVKTRDEFQIENNKYIELKSIFPCTSDLVCILDDRLDVWCHAHNVLQIYPYEDEHAHALYEKFSRNCTLKFPPYKKHPIVDEKSILYQYSVILQRIHHNFYDQFTPSISLCTSDIIDQLRHLILYKKYNFYVDANFLTNIEGMEERVACLIQRIQLIGGGVVEPTLKLQDQLSIITHIVVDKNVRLDSKYREIVNQIINVNSEHKIKFIKVKWVDICYYQWKRVKENDFLVDPHTLLEKIPSPMYFGKRPCSAENGGHTNDIINQSNKIVKTSENDEEIDGDDDDIYVSIANNGENCMDNEFAEEREKINQLTLTNDNDRLNENLNSDQNGLNDIKNNDELQSSNFYNKEDIESMADELESFLE